MKHIKWREKSVAYLFRRGVTIPLIKTVLLMRLRFFLWKFARFQCWFVFVFFFFAVLLLALYIVYCLLFIFLSISHFKCAAFSVIPSRDLRLYCASGDLRNSEENSKIIETNPLICAMTPNRKRRITVTVFLFCRCRISYFVFFIRFEYYFGFSLHLHTRRTAENLLYFNED